MVIICRLSGTELTMKDWKFRRMMKQSQLQFTEVQLMKILEGLGDKGQWRHALSVVEWVYNSKEHKQYKSRCMSCFCFCNFFSLMLIV